MSEEKQMPDDPNWRDLTDMWQSGSLDLDLNQVFKRARLNWWKIRLSVYSNVAASVTGAAACIYMAIDRMSWIVAAFASFGIVFCAASAWFSFQYRKRSFGSLSTEPRSLIRLQIKQLEGIILFAKFNFWACFGAFIFCLLAFVVLLDNGRTFAGDTVIFLVLGLVALGLLLPLPLYYRHIIQAKGQELTALQQSLERLAEDV